MLYGSNYYLYADANKASISKPFLFPEPYLSNCSQNFSHLQVLWHLHSVFRRDFILPHPPQPSFFLLKVHISTNGTTHPIKPEI